MSKVVALIGRPNVGKSTIFNRLVGKKVSIIEDTPGVTRDRIYGKVYFEDTYFHLIDTGGIEDSDDTFQKSIRIQAELAIDEADIILFVVDGKEGLSASDHLIKDMLLRSGKKVYVVVNKIDTKESKDNIYEFYELGFDDYYFVSGEQNEGIYDLLEAIKKELPIDLKEEDSSDILFSIVGRPNVGKSSLVNALLNEEKAIVSDVAGTTRDAVDTSFVYHDTKCTVIDTAGMRKRGKIYESIERYSLLRTLKAIDRSNVCVLVIDASEGIIEHDKHIAGYIKEAGKGIIIVVNKWDTIEDKEGAMKRWEEDIRANFQFVSYAPIVFLSAKTTKRIHTLMPEVLRVHENCFKEIPTSQINNVISEAYRLNIPPSYKGKRLKMYFTSQRGVNPPRFDIQVNSKGLVHFSYERYLENKIRESFDLTGTPIEIVFKNKGEESF
jgi:GTP-binding protein